MIKLSRFPIAIILSLAVCAAVASARAAAAQGGVALTAKTDRADAIYRQGEAVTFIIERGADSSLAEDAELEWSISKDGVPPIETGKVRLVNGKNRVTGRLSEPGFLLCRVTGMAEGKPVSTLAGAGIDPLLIKPSLPPPDDFDAFWSEQKKKLAAVPINLRLTPVAAKGTTNAESFDVQADCAGGAPVSGYYARPKGAKRKSLPAILLLHGAGVNSSSLPNALAWCDKGFLAMDINAHGLPNGKPAQFYKDLAGGALKEYRQAGRESRETCYFLGMFLRVLRAIDFLAAQPEWDGKTLVAYGSSQGGFQTFAAGGLDERVSFLAAGVPAGCDHTGAVTGRVSGWPKLVPVGANGKPDAKALQAARYFDNVNFAARTKAKGALVTVGFIDQTCPPTSVYAAYNNLSIPKQIYDDIPSGHANSPAATRARDQAVLQHVKSAE
jgi:cephalosporin-C deacetylase